MKVKSKTLSSGPTINIDGVYFKTNVSVTFDSLKRSEIPKAQKLLKELYFKTLATEMELGNIFEGTSLEKAGKLLAKKLNKIDKVDNG